MPLNLTEAQITTLTNALHTAARTYEECAEAVGRELPNTPSLFAQFIKQAREARELAEHIEENAETES